jgi:hypothetical protein
LGAEISLNLHIDWMCPDVIFPVYLFFLFELRVRAASPDGALSVPGWKVVATSQ